MRTFDIQEAKVLLSRLVDEAAKGEPFIIAKAGQPLVKVMPLNAPTGMGVKRIGFMAGEIEVPDDFDEMGRKNIERLFTSGEV